MPVRCGSDKCMIGLVRCIVLPVNVHVGSFRNIIGVVCLLRRIQSSRYEIGLQMQGSAALETTYTSLVCQSVWHLIKYKCWSFTAHALSGRDAWAAVSAHRRQGHTAERICCQMAAISIAVGSWGRICLRQTRRFACPLATTTHGNQEGTLDVRHERNAEVLRGVRCWLWASPSESECQIWCMAARYFEPVWCQAGQRNEGYARSNHESPEWARASVYRGTCWVAQIFMTMTSFTRVFYIIVTDVLMYISFVHMRNLIPLQFLIYFESYT